MFGNNSAIPSTQHGFSLIELMISIPLGLLIMFAVMEIFNSNLQSVYTQNSYARVQENGRMASLLMTRDIRGADYWGCANDMSLINNLLSTTDGDYDSSILPIGNGVEGVNNASSLVMTGVNGPINVVDGTDTLTLRTATSMSNVKVIAPYMALTSDMINISTNNDIAQGTLMMISDCVATDLFTNSNATTAANGNIGHSTVVMNNAMDNGQADLSTLYGVSAQILIPHIKQYFIGVNGEGSESLYRNHNGTINELVRNVSDLQIMLGEDSNDDGSVDTFADADAVSDMGNVLSVRMTITAESGSSTSGATLARDYQVTANIRNRTLE